jgi:hypothetical protein
MVLALPPGSKPERRRGRNARDVYFFGYLGRPGGVG